MVILVFQVSKETDGCLLIQTLLDNILQIRKSSAADKENILGIHSGQRHHGILAVGSHRNLHLTALQQLQHSLLYGLTAYVSLVRVLFLCDFVNLINKNDSVLCTLHIIACRCQKLADNTLNIIADISCLSQ